MRYQLSIISALLLIGCHERTPAMFDKIRITSGIYRGCEGIVDSADVFDRPTVSITSCSGVPMNGAYVVLQNASLLTPSVTSWEYIK